MEDKKKKQDSPSAGVEDLIKRLQVKGVEEGRAQADRIVQEADSRAKHIISQAELEAEHILNEARAEAEQVTKSGTDALKLAYRDTLLRLKQTLRNRFSNDVKRLVGKTMGQEEFIKHLILELTNQVSKDYGLSKVDKYTINIPKDVIGLEDLRQRPEEFEEGTLSHFVLSIMADLLKRGISVEITSETSRGLIVKMENNDIVIDFSDEAMTDAILKHLNPRFRALLEGVVK